MSAEHGTDVGGDSRRAALRVLVAVSRGRRSDRALDQEIRKGRLDDRDRRLTTEIVYGTLRRRGSLDRAIAAYSRKPWHRLEPAVRNAIRIGVYQSVFLDSVPPHAAVHSAVGAIPSRRRGARGVVNGVLRAWLRDGGRLESGDSDEGVPLDVPEWLARRWHERYGATESDRWFEAALLPPVPVVRAHPRTMSRERAAELLAGEGVATEPSPWVGKALRVRSGTIVSTALFAGGGLSTRGEAAQIVVDLMPPAPGGLALDACAGRGGKAVQLAEQIGCRRVIAADVAVHALRDCRSAAQRAQTPELAVTVADLAEAAPWHVRFDRILVDAPCSGVGTIRRNPEIKWRLRPERLGELGAYQRRILATTLDLLTPDGELFYVTCSTEPEENEQVVDVVLGQHREFEQIALKPAAELAHLAHLVGADGALRTFPHEPELDGFYVARLRRRPAGRSS